MNQRRLPQLPRQVIRETKVIEGQLWCPDWSCYCCHDSGLVNTRLVQMVIADYDPVNDKRPLCHASRCNKSMWACKASEIVASTCDWRFTKEICDELDQIERENWQKTVKQKFDIMRASKKLANDMSLRASDRTLEEQDLAQQKHRSVLDEMDDRKENDSYELEE